MPARNCSNIIKCTKSKGCKGIESLRSAGCMRVRPGLTNEACVRAPGEEEAHKNGISSYNGPDGAPDVTAQPHMANLPFGLVTATWHHNPF